MLKIVAECYDVCLYLSLLLALEPYRQGESIESHLIICFVFVFAVVNSSRTFYEPKSLSFAEDVASFACVGDYFSLLIEDIHPPKLEIVVWLTIYRVRNRLKPSFLLFFTLLSLHHSVDWHFSLLDTRQCCILRLLKIDIAKRMWHDFICKEIAPYEVDRWAPSWRQVENSKLFYNWNVLILHFIRYCYSWELVVFEGVFF